MNPKPVLYAWPSPSSRGVTVYETLLYRDGALSCNCPGWANAKPGKVRSCRHVRERHAEGQRIVDDVRAGRPIPRLLTVAPPAMPLKRAAGDGLVGDGELIGVLEL